MAGPATPDALPPEAELVLRRQRGVVRTLRAEGALLPLVLLAGVVALIALDGVVPFALGVVLALLPVPLVGAVLLRLDRFEPEPTRLIARTFLWGAGAATAIALLVNTVVGLTAGDFAAAVFSAPIVEEAAKALALVFVVRRRPGLLDGVHDGIVYAAWVGLGFATVENVLYYAEALASGGTEALAGTAVLRGLVTPLCHPIFTAMTGIGLGYMVARGRGRAGLAVGLLAGLALAIALHALWNLSASTGAAPYAYLLGYLPLSALGLALLVGGARRERRILRRGLAPEVERGTLSPAEFDLLCAGGRARARLRRRARRAAPGARQLVYRYEASAYELAHANAVGARPGRSDPAASAAALRASVVQVRTALATQAPGVLPA
ncbi:MAG: PrsW family intramembrane metalloprotease [Gaiellales bacterium]